MSPNGDMWSSAAETVLPPLMTAVYGNWPSGSGFVRVARWIIVVLPL